MTFTRRFLRRQKRNQPPPRTPEEEREFQAWLDVESRRWRGEEQYPLDIEAVARELEHMDARLAKFNPETRNV